MAQETATIKTADGIQQVTLHTSARGTLTLRDATKGAVMAAISAGLATAQQLISNGWDELFTDHTGKTVGLAAIGGITAYLLKNLFTDTKIVEVTP